MKPVKAREGEKGRLCSPARRPNRGAASRGAALPPRVFTAALKSEEFFSKGLCPPLARPLRLRLLRGLPAPHPVPAAPRRGAPSSPAAPAGLSGTSKSLSTLSLAQPPGRPGRVPAFPPCCSGSANPTGTPCSGDASRSPRAGAVRGSCWPGRS